MIPPDPRHALRAFVELLDGETEPLHPVSWQVELAAAKAALAASPRVSFTTWTTPAPIGTPSMASGAPKWLAASPAPPERMFPIQGGPHIPWSVIAACEYQMKANHDQSAETLARRGGLCPSEAVDVLLGDKWNTCQLSNEKAIEKMLKIVQQRQQLAASPAPNPYHSHAAAPTGYRCADCQIDGEPCPRCYEAGWRQRHPNVQFAGAASPASLAPAAHEFVICAAVKTVEGKIIRGHRHDGAIITAGNMGLHLVPYRDDQQGFVTSRGRYVNRMEAAAIQQAAGIKSVDNHRIDFPTELFSEDLY